MVNLKEKNIGDPVWAVKQEICEMIYPTEVLFQSPESLKSNKLAFIEMDNKKICYPTNLLFDSKVEAEIYASITFIKMYYASDPFEISDEIDDSVLFAAQNMVEKFEEQYPDRVLYYWMNSAPRN